MSRQFHKGFLFLNNLNLCSERKKPLGRIDDSFSETVRKKLDYVINYAEENELKIIIMGNTFKGFEFEPMSTFISAFSKVSPVVYAGKLTNTLEFFKNLNFCEVIVGDQASEHFNIVSDDDFEEYQVDFLNSYDKGYIGLETDGFFQDKKGLLVCNSYVDSEIALSNIDAIVCGKWDSVVTAVDTYKFFAPSIVRDDYKKKDITPSFLVWTPENGLAVQDIPCEKEVFDDFDFTVRLNENNTSNFAEKLKASSEISLDGDSVGDLIENLYIGSHFSQDTKQTLSNLLSQVEGKNPYSV